MLLAYLRAAPFLLFSLLSVTAGLPSAAADETVAKIAVSVARSGDEAGNGESHLKGMQLALDELNAEAVAPPLAFEIHDDLGTPAGSADVARRVAASDAAVVLGPAFSTSSLAAGPIYAEAGVASLPLTATSDSITRNATTFRVIFKNTDQGKVLAYFLSRVLGKTRANVLCEDNAYGHTLQDGFAIAAYDLKLDARYAFFKTAEEAEQLAREVAEDGDRDDEAVVLLTLDAPAASILKTMRRLGRKGPFLGGDALADTVLSDHLVNEPEERRQPGYYTDNVYGLSPMILDSANAEILAFAERYKARYGRPPAWESLVGYDAVRLAGAAIRSVWRDAKARADKQRLRAAVLTYLRSLDSPAHSVAGLLGPMWFDDERGRRDSAIRVGRFRKNRFESAPVQFVAVAAPDRQEIASGAVFPIEFNRYFRLQRVVVTGFYLNEIPRVDLAKSTFGADLYIWMRYARDAGSGASDPTDLIFPDLVSGKFNREKPDEQASMPDGTEYRLWRLQGDFRNEYHLYRFPFDRQDLRLSFYHARADASRLVYALDEQTAPPAVFQEGTDSGARLFAVAAPSAFRELTQWNPIDVWQRRENLVTRSALGDPRRVGGEGQRELSGFLASVEIERKVVATLVKNLLPLFIMTLVMFASLHFPHGLVKEKVTVAITGALSGAVLLTAINNQLGAVGYTLAVEYAFFVFFGLSLLCIVSVLYAERLRVAGRGATALVVERSTRVVFALAVAAVAAGAVALGLWGAS